MIARRSALPIALAFALLQLATAGSAQNAPITFTVIGDIPYSSSEIADFEGHVADNNVFSPGDFFVHVGDIKSGSSSCVESHYVSAANVLHGLAVPGFIVPGDNEWNDCSNPDQAWAFWEEHLLGLEQDFCGVPADFEAQSVRPENFAFTSKGVLFIGLNLVGGSVHSSSEWSTRLQQNADFVNQQLAEHGSQVRAMAVFGQAGPSSNRSLFFNQFVASASAFGKPVLFIHGDGHSWIFDHPFSVQQILRVQVPQGDPVEVVVSLASVDPFTVERDPWPNGTPVFNKPPCVEAEGDGAVDFGEAASVGGLVTDDGDPDPPSTFSVAWSRLSGPGNVTFANPGAVQTTASFSAPGSYVLRLTANDGQLTSSDDVPVQVGSSGPSLSIDDLFVLEGDAAVFTVTLAGGTGSSVSVGYSTAQGSASSGDYAATSGTLSFSGSTTTRTISVAVTEDALVESSETFFVNLANASGATIAKPQGAAIILDDDVPAPFTLAVATSGSGSVNLSPPGGSYAPGSVVTLTAVSGQGFAFAGWSGDLSGTTNPATLTMSADRSVTASFAPVPTFTLAVSSVGGGSVSLAPPGGVYAAGTPVTLSALADPGFAFEGWSGDLSGAANPATLVVAANASVTATFGPFVPPEILVLAPSADAHVQSGGPGSNYGGLDHLRAKMDSTTYRGYLRFDLPGFATNVQRATLRLRVTDASASGGSAHAVSNTYAGTSTAWTETGLTWSNAPAVSGAALDSAGAAAVGAWIELDVTGAIAGTGALSLAIQSLSDDSVRYSSKEGADPPQLVLELEPAPDPTPVACENGLDDDGDGLADFPADPGCADPADDSEHAANLPCDDGVDNDGDTHVDFPADPSCKGVLSVSESSVQTRCGLGFELALVLPLLGSGGARALARALRRASGAGV